MSKKIMLLALAAVSAAFFALPTMASAFELHVEGAAGKGFIAEGAGGTLSATEEPSIICTKTGGGGSFTTETTGEVELVFTGCNATILGIKLPCKSGEAAETIITKQVFHLITIGTTEKPGVLLTPPFPTIKCGSGLSERKIQITGNGVIGTITSPACGTSSSSMVVGFKATNGHQEHKLWTGTEYDLKVTTDKLEEAHKTAGIEGEATLKFNDGVARKLNCT